MWPGNQPSFIVDAKVLGQVGSETGSRRGGLEVLGIEVVGLLQTLAKGPVAKVVCRGREVAVRVRAEQVLAAAPKGQGSRGLHGSEW